MQGLNYTELEKRGFVDTCCKFGIPSDSAERLYKSAFRIRIPRARYRPRRLPVNTRVPINNAVAEDAARAARAARTLETEYATASRDLRGRQPASKLTANEPMSPKGRSMKEETQLSSAKTQKLPRQSANSKPSMKAYLNAQQRGAGAPSELPAGTPETTRILPATDAGASTVPPASGGSGAGGGGAGGAGGAGGNGGGNVPAAGGTPGSMSFARRMLRSKWMTPFKKIWGFAKTPKVLFPAGLGTGWWLANKFQDERDESQKVPTLTPTENLLWNEAGNPWNSLGYDTDVSDIW